jgi:hydroxymethylglutaryl-CoA lyase
MGTHGAWHSRIADIRQVPQMAGTAEVLKQLPKVDGITYTCLAPNQKALELYWETKSDEKCDELIIFAASSESFNKGGLTRRVAWRGLLLYSKFGKELRSNLQRLKTRVQNRTVAQSMKICEEVAEKARAKGVRLRGSISTVIGCPFEGAMDPKLTADLVKAFLDMGCYQVALGDTIGVGTPATFERLINEITKSTSIDKLAVSSNVAAKSAF